MQHELKSTPDKKNATTFNVGFQTQHSIPNTVLGNMTQASSYLSIYRYAE